MPSQCLHDDSVHHTLKEHKTFRGRRPIQVKQEHFGNEEARKFINKTQNGVITEKLVNTELFYFVASYYK